MPDQSLTGQRYGRLTIIGIDDTRTGSHSRPYVICRCDCGKTKSIRLEGIKSGSVKSCSCLQKENRATKARVKAGRDALVNAGKFGRLTVIRYAGSTARWKRLVECRCDCGNIAVVRLGMLKCGNTSSCGCLRAENAAEGRCNRKHSQCYTPEYRSWAHIVQRCTNQKNAAWDDYGGRGITMYEPWRKDFSAFLSYVGPRPSPKHSIDRLNNNEGYEPGNIAWRTKIQQARNTRLTVLVDYQGTRRPLRDVCDEIGFDIHLAYSRHLRGWPDSNLFLPRGSTYHQRPGHSFDTAKLEALLASGKSRKEISITIGISYAAVCKYVAKDMGMG